MKAAMGCSLRLALTVEPRTHIIIEFYLQSVLPEVGVVIVHVGLDRGTKKISASGVFRVFASLLQDSLIKKGLLYAYSC